MRRLSRWAFLLLAAILVAVGMWHGLQRDSVVPAGMTGSAAMGLMLLEEPEGLYVLAVSDRSTAYHAGIEPGDYLILADGAALSAATQFDEIMSSCTGDLPVTIRRSAQELTVLLPCR